MSSIVKKASQFIPNLKKKGIRRKTSVNLGALLTPPATQATQSTVEPSSNEPSQSTSTDSSTQKEGEVITPKRDTPRFSFSLETSKNVTPLKAGIEDDIDPKDTSRKVSLSVVEDSEGSEEDKSDDENNYGEIDIFKSPEESASSRKHSIIQAQRRLSGITPNIIRHRSVSISAGPHLPPSSESQDAQGNAPMRIGIPVNKPVKRRKSLVLHKPNKRTLSLGATVIQNPKNLVNLSIDKTSGTVDEEIEQKVVIPTNEAKFIVGIDPKTNKLRKFRVSTVEGGEDTVEEVDELMEDGKVIPFAPEDLNTTITSSKQLPKRIKEEDRALYAQVGVNIEEITMADLCKPDLPIGEVSNNFELVKAAQDKIRKERQKRRQNRRIARQTGVSLEDIENEGEEEGVKKQKVDLLGLDNDDEPPVLHSSLKLTMKDGRISYDVDSTVVNRHARRDNDNRSVEESNPFENPITSSTYSKRKHTDRWTSDELKQFYEALSTWGTDFTFIAQLFPYRTRKQIKSKFNLEEKKFPEIIEMALKRKLPADFEKYCSDSKNKIETLEYYNNELRQVRIKHDEHMALIAEEREKAIKEDAEASRRREFEIRTGSRTMTRAEKVKELRKNEMVLGSIEDVKKQRNDA